MAKNENESMNSEDIAHGDTPPDNAVRDRKTVLTAKRLETVVAVLLGITTLLSAWATWIGSLHSGIQSINFTKSNNMASQGTAVYDMSMQLYLSDYMTWITAKDYYFDLEIAKAENDQDEIKFLTEKIKRFTKESGSPLLIEAVKWMEENDKDDPFQMPGLSEKYCEEAQKSLDQSQELLEEGMRDNTKGDSYNLVTVIYSLTLFLLGIVGTFKNMPNRIAVLSIAVVFLIIATVYMCTIPLPTGFAQMNFFEFNK